MRAVEGLVVSGSRRRALAAALAALLTTTSCAAVKVIGIGQAALLGLSSTRVSNYLYNSQPYQKPGFADLSPSADAHHVPVLMGTVEVTDAGYFANPGQVQAVLDTLGPLARRYNLTIVVYAHGWRHNSSPGDHDVLDFQRTLRAIDLIVRQAEPTRSSVVRDARLPRAVVGIYLGWKGKSTFEWPDSWGWLKAAMSLHVYTTFWNRKTAADRAGRGDLRRFLLAVAALHESWRDTTNSYNSNSLNLVGHSFGGHLILTALRDQLEESLIQAETKEPVPSPTIRYMPNDPAAQGVKLERRLHASMGNIILINPAVEEALVRQIYEASRADTFVDGQPPIVSVFSAENDWARNVLFKAGTKLANLGVRYRRNQRRLATTALGSGGELVTDTLRLERRDAEALKWAHEPVGEPERVAKGVGVGVTPAAAWVPEDVREATGRIGLHSRDGVRRSKAAVIATVDKNVIDNHSGFWREGFMEWLVSYVVALDRGQTVPGAAQSASR